MGTAAPVPEQPTGSQSSSFPSSSPSSASSASSASSLSLADDPLAEPTLVDQRRFWANHAGLSVAEIAQSSGVSEEEVTLSILRVRNDNGRYSATAAGVEARKIFIRALPRISSALDEALVATRLEGKKVVLVDKETGESVTMEETVERPDHEVRLQAIDRARSVFSVVQPRDPAVQIVSNSQTNILHQGGPAQVGAGAGHSMLTSPEAVIRSIVAQRALALTDGKSVVIKPTTLEGVPVMARDSELPVELPVEMPDEQEPDEGDDDDEEEGESDEDDEGSDDPDHPGARG